MLFRSIYGQKVTQEGRDEQKVHIRVSTCSGTSYMAASRFIAFQVWESVLRPAHNASVHMLDKLRRAGRRKREEGAVNIPKLRMRSDGPLMRLELSRFQNLHVTSSSVL